jgi:hypothetical protein
MAYAFTNRFNFGGHDFYMYSAQDSHGSACCTLMVDGKCVTEPQWREHVISSLGAGIAVIRNRLSGADFFGVCDEVQLQDVDFSLNGVQFHCFIYPYVPGKAIGPHVYKVDGVDVKPEVFRERVVEALGEGKRHFSLMFRFEKPDFIHALLGRTAA